METKKILVLGGAGFVGYHLTSALAADRRASVTVCDNLSRGKMDADFQALLSAHPNVQFFNTDLTSRDSFGRLDTDFEHVYLLAGKVGVRYALESPDRVVFTNTSIVLNTVEWLTAAPQSKLLFASTSETYGGALKVCSNFPIPTPESVPLVIEDILNPRYSYAASKILGEAAVVAYRKARGLRAVIIRYHNVYGPRMGYAHAIPEISLRLLQRESPFRLYGSDEARAFCYVSDAVNATIASMESQRTDGEIIHIGTQEETRIEQLAQKLCALADFHPPLQKMPSAPGSVNRRCPDLRKAREWLGYIPEVGLDEGLRHTFAWYAADFAKNKGGIQP